MIPQIIVVSLRRFLKETVQSIVNEILRRASNKMGDFVKDTTQARHNAGRHSCFALLVAHKRYLIDGMGVAM